jgi:hypothetical protein
MIALPAQIENKRDEAQQPPNNSIVSLSFPLSVGIGGVVQMRRSSPTLLTAPAIWRCSPRSAGVACNAALHCAQETVMEFASMYSNLPHVDNNSRRRKSWQMYQS